MELLNVPLYWVKNNGVGMVGDKTIMHAYMHVVVSVFHSHRNDRGSNPSRGDISQVLENHMPRVHPHHEREIGEMGTVRKTISG